MNTSVKDRPSPTLHGNRATGATTALLRFMTENPGRPITINELQDHFSSWTRTQIMNNMTNLVRAAGSIKIEKIRAGVWCYNNETSKKSDQGPELVLLEVLRRQPNGQLWAVNEDGNLFKLIPMQPIEA